MSHSILLKNADWIITMDSNRRKLYRQDVFIEGKVISKIGEHLEKTIKPDKIIDATGKIILPGFVNTHHHCWQSLVRNLPMVHGLSLVPWLHLMYNIFQDVSPEVVAAGATVALGDLLKTGCTTSIDHHYIHPKQVRENLIDVEIKAAEKLGIRFHPTRGSLSIGQAQSPDSHVPDTLVETMDDIMIDSERLINTYHDTERFAMVQIGLAPCYYGLDSTADLMSETLKMARHHGIRCHSHLAEGKTETAYAIEKLGCRPLEYVEKLGWLGEDISYAHGIHFNDEELKLIAETGTGIAHCPTCNMFVSSGVCRVPDLLELGATVGLGVDGTASSTSSNMMTEIRVAYLVHQLTYGGRGPSPEQVLEIATRGGAKILGRDDIGHLAEGMAADLAMMDWSRLQYAGGKNDPVA